MKVGDTAPGGKASAVEHEKKAHNDQAEDNGHPTGDPTDSPSPNSPSAGKGQGYGGIGNPGR